MSISNLLLPNDYQLYINHTGGSYAQYNVTAWTDTTIITANEYQKANTLNTIAGLTSDDWTIDTVLRNRMVYSGSINKVFRASVSVGMQNQDISDQTLAIRIAKNGVTLPNSTMQALVPGTGGANVSVISTSINVEMSSGDYLELFVTNTINNGIVLRTTNINMDVHD